VRAAASLLQVARGGQVQLFVDQTAVLDPAVGRGWVGLDGRRRWPPVEADVVVTAGAATEWRVGGSGGGEQSACRRRATCGDRHEE
jgi:hypothetical protein